MAIRRPLVIDNGVVKELPIGDSLDDAEQLTMFAVPVISLTQGNLVSTGLTPSPELVFDSSGDIIMTLVREEDI